MRRFIFVLALLMLAAGFSTATVSAADQTYVVQRGDTLFRISLKFNTSVSALAAANGISNVNLIFAGQTLTIPTGGGTSGGGTSGGGTGCTGGGTTYTVQPGDWLNKIALKFGTTYQAIASANGISNPNLIFAGMQLKINGCTTGGGTTGPSPTPIPGVPTPAPSTGGFALGGQVFGFNYPDQMKGAGMTWAKSQVNWNGSDGASIASGPINAAHSRGFKILLSIKGDKGQIASNPSQYYQNFANFVGGVAALGPDAIEVWNEENIDREWPAGSISGAAYTQMLSAAYGKIKQANPNVLVISGAPSPTGFFGGACTANGCDDQPYLQAMASSGAGQFFDCTGIHYNEGILPPTATSGDPRGNSGHYTRYYPTMVSTYRGVFPSKPLCFTELGYLSPEGFGPLPAGFEWAANTSAQEQAQWLAQAVTAAKGSGFVRLLIIWNVDSTTYGADPQAGYAMIRGNQCLACITVGSAMGK